MTESTSLDAADPSEEGMGALPLPYPAEALGGSNAPRDWRTMLRGRGVLQTSGQTLCLANEGADAEQYTNAQIDDYQGIARRNFPWRPPLVLALRARFSHPGAMSAQPAHGPALAGTAGFGFWNDPFMMTDRRPPALPRALWFFYASPPSDMKLDLRTPGWGWKAASIDAARWPARVLLPFAPLTVPLMHVRSFYHGLWPAAQRVLHICEAAVPVDMTEWHDYEIEWGHETACFAVDGKEVLACEHSPRGPLGMVLWIDNQYLVATPQGRFRYGLLQIAQRQWLELADLEITRQPS